MKDGDDGDDGDDDGGGGSDDAAEREDDDGDGDGNFLTRAFRLATTKVGMPMHPRALGLATTKVGMPMHPLLRLPPCDAPRPTCTGTEVREARVFDGEPR